MARDSLLGWSFNYNGMEFCICEEHPERVLAFSEREPEVKIEVKESDPKFKELQARKNIFKRFVRDIKKGG